MPVNKLNKHAKNFLLTKSFGYIQGAFITLLINIYLWRLTEAISIIVLYNVVLEISRVLTYIPAGKVSKEYDRFLPLRAGFLLNLLFLGLVLVLKEQMVIYIIPVAIVGGIAKGVYWSSDNLLKFDLTSPRNRLKFATSMHMVKEVIYTLFPLLASILVVLDGGDTVVSYSRIFIPAMFFSLLGFISTYFISKKHTIGPKRYHLLKEAKLLLKNKKVIIALQTTFLSSIAGVLPILLSLLLFFSSGTELSIGGYQFVNAGLALVAYYLIGKYLVRKNYKHLLIWGGLINFLLIFILLFRQDYVAILVYGMLSGLFSISNIPVYPLTLDALNSICKTQKECADARVEYTTLSEFFLGAGRVLGFVVLLLISQSINFYTLSAVVLIFALTRLLANINITRLHTGRYVTIEGLN